MRKLLVSNFQTLDGYYESTNKTFDRFFDYFHEDYGANEAFDQYNTELLRGADTLILSGRAPFIERPGTSRIARPSESPSSNRRKTPFRTPARRSCRSPMPNPRPPPPT